MALCDDYSIEELIAMTDKLVKKLCSYGGGNFCDCGFDKDKPESNGGCFGFMQKENAELKERVEVLDKQFK